MIIVLYLMPNITELTNFSRTNSLEGRAFSAFVSGWSQSVSADARAFWAETSAKQKANRRVPSTINRIKVCLNIKSFEIIGRRYFQNVTGNVKIL